MHDRSEKELWQQFTSGDREAFSELYRQCYRRLYSYGVSFGMSQQSASDAIQDLFMRLYRNPALVKNTDTLLAMMFRAVRNFHINDLKKRERLSALDETDAKFDFSYTIDETIINQEQRDEVKLRVAKLLESLTPRQREIIYLRYYLGLDYEAIGSVMDYQSQVARNLMSKALRRMRKVDSVAVKILVGITLLN